jgi:hypothetical protein
MTVWTKGIITQHIGVDDIADVLKTQYGVTDVKVIPNNARDGRQSDLFRITFTEKNSRLDRQMSVHANSSTKSDNKDVWQGDQTVIHLGDYGDSRKITREILETFGGYLMESDEDDNCEWERIEPVNGLTAEELEDNRIKHATQAGIATILKNLQKGGFEYANDPVFVEHLTQDVTEAVKNTFGKNKTDFKI